MFVQGSEKRDSTVFSESLVPNLQKQASTLTCASQPSAACLCSAAWGPNLEKLATRELATPRWYTSVYSLLTHSEASFLVEGQEGSHVKPHNGPEASNTAPEAHHWAPEAFPVRAESVGSR